ncbi:hypothetical protein WEI85_07740 [Actinomycetes bacterium KLBMP 9797]
MHQRGALVGVAVRRAYAPRDVSDPTPQLIAAWDGSGELADLDAPARPGGHDTARLITLLAEPLTSQASPPSTRPVWRCTLELEAGERRLSEREWGDAVRELLHEAGLAPRGDHNAVRWIAVAHGGSRVDIVATLVRQDGRIEPARDDRRRCVDATHALERRLRLRPAPPTPATTPPVPPHAPPSRRTTPPSTRDRLRRQVRAAAIVATDEDDFFARLRGAGLRVRLRPGHADDRPSGYAVSHPASPGGGQPVWFGGGQLAPELSLPHLRNRWARTPRTHDEDVPASAGQRQRVWQQASDAVSTESNGIADHAEPVAAERIHAVADILTAAASALPDPPAHLVFDAAELLHRAIGRSRPTFAPDARAVHLRSLARLVGLMGQLSDDRDFAAALHLVYLIAGFADSLATVRQAQQQRSHAAAAYTAAAHLHAASRPRPPNRAATAPTAGTPPAPVAVPVAPWQHSRRRSR